MSSRIPLNVTRCLVALVVGAGDGHFSASVPFPNATPTRDLAIADVATATATRT